jgi:glucose-1-phosphate thymidylyltransferase
VAADFPALEAAIDTNLEMTLIVNARLAPTFTNFAKLNQFIKSHLQSDTPVAAGQAVMAMKTGLLRSAAEKAGVTVGQFAAGLFASSSADSLQFQTVDMALTMLDFPHDIIDAHMKCCAENLEFRLTSGEYQQLTDGVYLSKKSPASIPESTVFDSSDGPIIIDSGCSIGPFTYFRGPVYIGPGSKISEHSSIKDSVAIGHTCKIGGEVEGVIVEPYSNKQHYGFLGHSYLGSWINLGAGTCNSDLKNTYGMVNMQSLVEGQEKISTGMQFMGCLIGDYAKTAINTSIFTGKLIGVGSMVYAMATTNVPSFVNYARSIGQMGLLPPEVIVTTQRRMFGRRKVEQRDCDAQLIRDMYELTKAQRPDGLTSDQLEF